MLRLPFGVAAAGALAGTMLGLAGCASGSSSPAAKDADAAADRAGIVMVQVNGITPGQRIARVVGKNNTRTIDALEADATAEGRIVLRIVSTVDSTGFNNGTDTATRCYRYQFQAGYLSSDAHRVRCPDRPVVPPSPAPAAATSTP